MKTIKLALVLFFSAIISACGGGGGDGGLGSSAPTTPLDITATNQQAITAAALNYAISGSAIDAFSVNDFLKALNETPCASGSVIFDPTTLINFMAGTITFFNCSYVAGKSFNGTVTFSNLTTSLPNNVFNPDSVSARLKFDFLTITKASLVASPVTLSGDYNLNAAGLNVLSATTTMISPVGTSLKLNSNIAETISNFNISNVLNTGINSSDNNDFTLASSSLGGQVGCDTTTPFVNVGGTFPNSGVLIITSTLNSNQLRVTALGDETQVKVELSTSGGSIYNAPVLYTWAELFPPP
jgi:hypothetical protein